MVRLLSFARYFLVVFSCAAVTACQKAVEEVKCYECDMTYSTGIAAGTQFPCSADIAQWQREQKDNNGNPITSVCKEK